MQLVMKTYVQQTLQFTEDKSTSSPVDSHVNHTQQQGSDLGKPMKDISFLKCLDALKRLNPDGLLAKTFVDLLVGMEGWYSTRCTMTWKGKDMKSNRFLFQLQVSTHRTGGIESGLLPTPTTKAETREPVIEDGKVVNRSKKTGTRYGTTLDQLLQVGLLPTPMASDMRVHYKTENWKGTSDLGSVINDIHGTRSHLSP